MAKLVLSTGVKNAIIAKHQERVNELDDDLNHYKHDVEHYIKQLSELNVSSYSNSHDGATFERTLNYLNVSHESVVKTEKEIAEHKHIIWMLTSFENFEIKGYHENSEEDAE